MLDPRNCTSHMLIVDKVVVLLMIMTNTSVLSKLHVICKRKITLPTLILVLQGGATQLGCTCIHCIDESYLTCPLILPRAKDRIFFLNRPRSACWNLAEKHCSGWNVVREKHCSGWKKKPSKPASWSAERGLFCYSWPCCTEPRD